MMQRGRIAAILVLACVGLSPACKSKDERAGASRTESERASDTSEGAIAPAEKVMEESPLADDESRGGGDLGRMAKSEMGEKKNFKGKRSEPGTFGGGGALEQGPAARAWFPETFLFEPLVVTDESGAAEVGVRVPDRLTSWRVLGLAHSRAGAQAGATHSFAGTLDAHVDPVVPSFLRVGDRAELPVQVINNSEQAVEGDLVVEVQGGKLDRSSQSLRVEAGSSVLRYVELAAEVPGEIRLMARFGDRDMVVRTIEVQRTGRRVVKSKSGTLATARSISIPHAESVGAPAEVRLAVFPGALALFRSELDAGLERPGLAHAAYGMLLAGQAPELLAALGETEVDVEYIRKLTIKSTQKVMHQARVLDAVSASLVAQAAASHEDNIVLQRLAKRAVQQIESGQKPDGTCGDGNGWTLQRLLVVTADCARAAHSLPNVRIRASGAFERYAKDIADPYTAAAILAAAGASGQLKEKLQKLVLDAIESKESGLSILKLPRGVLRVDGLAPTELEATALAILALADVADAPLADLGATILASYSPRTGWGDGRANLVAMQAALALFKEPLPARVKISLRKDGELVAEGELNSENTRDLLHLRVEGLVLAGESKFEVVSEPAVAGLGFSLELVSWLPWTESKTPGLELGVDLPETFSRGRAAAVAVSAIAPSAQPFRIELALPAGVQVEERSLDALVASGALLKHATSGGRLRLDVAGLLAGQRFAAALRFVPTLQGRFASGPATISLGEAQSQQLPVTWEVR